MLRLTVVFVALSLLACANALPPPKHSYLEDYDEEADDDADDDTDDDTDDDDVSACGPYSGIALGRSWSWTYADEYYTGWSSSTVVEWDEAEGAGVLETAAFYQGDDYTMDSTGETRFRCDDGFILDEVLLDYSGESAGGPYSGSSVTTYARGGPLYPLAIAEGDTWTVRYAGLVENEVGQAPFDYTTTYTAEVREDVTVEAGTFSAWRVQSVVDGSETTNVFWLSSGVGIVKTEETELSTYEP